MLDDDGLLPDSFASKHSDKLKVCNQKWYAKYRSMIAKFGYDWCRLNIRQDSDSEQYDHKHKEPLWPSLLYYFYFYCTTKVILSIYHQFVVGYHRHKVKKFDQIANNQMIGLNSTPLQRAYLETFKNQLVADYEGARKSYKAIGAPFMNLDSITTNVLIYLVIVNYITYLQPYLYYKYKKPFNATLIYTISAHHKLQESVESIIRDRVNNFIASSRAYNSRFIDEKVRESLKLRLYRRGLRSMECSKGECADRFEDSFREHLIQKSYAMKKALAARVSINHNFLVRQVKLMALNGMFQPLNRNYDWVEVISNIFSSLTFLSYIFCTGYLFGFTFLLPYLNVLDFGYEQDPLDVLFHVEIFIYSGIPMFSVIFHTTLSVTMSIDQTLAVSKLNNLIEDCILHNTCRLRDYIGDVDALRIYEDLSYMKCSGDYGLTRMVRPRPPPKSTNKTIPHPIATDTKAKTSSTIDMTKLYTYPNVVGPLSDIYRYTNGRYVPSKPREPFDLINKSINLCLMLTVLHYKIFVQQSKPLLDSVQDFASGAFFLALLPLIVLRLLMAYIDLRQKAFSIIVSFFCLLAVDLAFVLINHFHARCLDIYRHLQSLMAHIIDMDQVVRLRTGREAYDRHLVWMLRRELSHPDRVTDQFAARLSGGHVKLTYPNMMKYHFWWGFLAISIMVIDPSSQNSSDVFGGVWRYYDKADVDVIRFFQNHFGKRENSTNK